MNDSIIEYQKLQPSYETFSKRLESLLIELLRSEKIKTHFTESRAKSIESFAQKLNRPDKNYDDPFRQMPDLSGVRIVLYYFDDIQDIENLIYREFDTIEKVDTHQSEQYSPDKFGYLSMHYIVKLNSQRANLTEWKMFAKFHAEIQVRTVLQHSWAAVSHALQYKREGDIPLTLRRRLFRLAGLFELVDEEFISIRNEKEKINQSTYQKSIKDLQTKKIDAPIIHKFLDSSEELTTITYFMRDIGFEFIEEDNEEPFVEVGKIVEACELLKIGTINDLEEYLKYDYEKYLKAIIDDGGWQVDTSFSLLLLLICGSPSSFPYDYLTKWGWDEELANNLISDLAKVDA